MKKAQDNYAFIDGQNLNLSIKELGWDLDFNKFRIYLSEKYGVKKAYYFIGYISGNDNLYTSLQSYGYILVFKPTLITKEGKIKGNCDAELVLQAMIDLNKYSEAVLVTGDGDFACLISYLRKVDKLHTLLSPSRIGCSILLKKASHKQIAFMDGLKDKLVYKKKRTP